MSNHVGEGLAPSREEHKTVGEGLVPSHETEQNPNNEFPLSREDQIVKESGGVEPLPYIGSENLPHRKYIRYRKHDYSSFGGYFLTICSHEKQQLFSEIEGEGENAKVCLSRAGKIVDAALLKIPMRFPSVEVDKYVIMPNHIHMILLLNPTKEGTTPPSVPQIIGAFKSIVANECRKTISLIHVFQRSYYDHVIRDRKDYFNVVRYIENNPHNWSVEQFFIP